MGAQLDTCKEVVHSAQLKMKREKLEMKAMRSRSNSNEFFIEYARSNKDNDRLHCDTYCSQKRRLVFVSLMGLYLTWKQSPTPILYSSLFVLPLRREWVYYPLRYQQDIEMHFEISLFSDVNEREEFMELLKWKDAQGLMLWMLDEHETNKSQPDESSLIHPVWHYVNRKLTNIYDPVTGRKYEPINLDENWWNNEEKYVSRYDVKPATILSEFYFVALKFKNIQEIIYQSNPNSFLPVISYQHNEGLKDRATDIYNYFDDGDDLGNWWISNDYDPES